ncbi:helicase POLQ-like isoform X2 [Nematostella vectensis]|uniref:helicase POLQ-like isoform X2 n=1 Tax=Nematostella vectensis TaxID=45351 RepID=UPI0020776E7F|nr:helicase POLQ-like isoform X2 [Nematostella vectensis]
MDVKTRTTRKLCFRKPGQNAGEKTEDSSESEQPCRMQHGSLRVKRKSKTPHKKRKKRNSVIIENVSKLKGDNNIAEGKIDAFASLTSTPIAGKPISKLMKKESNLENKELTTLAFNTTSSHHTSVLHSISDLWGQDDQVFADFDLSDAVASSGQHSAPTNQKTSSEEKGEGFNDTDITDAIPSTVPGAPEKDQVQQITAEEHPKLESAFYGLPIKVKDLFLAHRGIQNLYEWQDACLKLPAIQEKRNLIYSLPTSGGKTLVAEILMMKELLVHHKDVMLVLPFVSIVQEKVKTITQFAVELGFVVEEYAGSKGKFPPRKRRTKRALYIATIEKANSLVNSLIEEKRMDDLGLIVVDELHMLGEGGGRGATLEMCLAKTLFSTNHIQIVGMSATLSNIGDLQKFLMAEVYSNDFRPVELQEYVKVDNIVYKVPCSSSKSEADEIYVQVRHISHSPTIGKDQRQIKDPGKDQRLIKDPGKDQRQIKDPGKDQRQIKDPGKDQRQIKDPGKDQRHIKDPDHLVPLVLEVIPQHSCLIFCATKKNCENVAKLMVEFLPREMTQVKIGERMELLQALHHQANGLCPVLKKSVPYGIAYHHSGLTMDERKLIEDAYSQGVLCALTCTSTLAAGVNLPAKRVILRAPYIGRNIIRKSQYKQMIGRAGRAGIDSTGESILIIKTTDKHKVAPLFSGEFDSCQSSLPYQEYKGLRTLFLTLLGLKICQTKSELVSFLSRTLMAIQLGDSFDADQHATEALRTLVSLGHVKAVDDGEDHQIEITPLGRATYKGSLDIDDTPSVYSEIKRAMGAMVLTNELHLLYLTTPLDQGGTIQPDWMAYQREVATLGPEEQKAAGHIGVTDLYLLGRAYGRRLTKCPVGEEVVHRFYLSLMLYKLMQGSSMWHVSSVFQVSRGFVQNLLTSAASYASCLVRFTEARVRRVLDDQIATGSHGQKAIVHHPP